jgi:hypothetical protein
VCDTQSCLLLFTGHSIHSLPLINLLRPFFFLVLQHSSSLGLLYYTDFLVKMYRVNLEEECWISVYVADNSDILA